MRLLHLASALSPVSFALAWTTYVVPHTPGQDDAATLAAAFSAHPEYATDATILFQRGVTYNLETPVNFPVFENVIVSVQGNLTYGADIKKTQAIVADTSKYKGAWFAFGGGSNITLQGSQDQQQGWVIANGQQWWDAMQKVAARVNRPVGWGFNGITNGEIKYMKLSQPIAWNFEISGVNLHVHHNTIVAKSNSKSLTYNTDGFDVQGTNILLEENTVYNGDDCLALCSPAKNVQFINSYCYGSHGLTIIGAATGGTADFQNVLIENVVMENSGSAAKFKSWPQNGYSGNARNITWNNITLKKVQTPIVVDQNYYDVEWPEGSGSSTGSNTVIDGLVFQNFQGTVADTKKNHDIITLDVYPGLVKSLTVRNISVKTVTGAAPTVKCNSDDISVNVGFKCLNGPFELA